MGVARFRRKFACHAVDQYVVYRAVGHFNIVHYHIGGAVGKYSVENYRHPRCVGILGKVDGIFPPSA